MKEEKNDNDRTQNQVNQATDSCGIASADTTAPRPWTPGPWARLHETINSESADIVSAFDSCDRVAVTCPQNEDGVELANARLIVSAPGLFEALDTAPRGQDFDTVEEFLEAHEHWYTGQRRAAMDKALGVGE